MPRSEPQARGAAPKPLVSVLLPVYNAETTLRRALRSLLRQSYDHWECILVDDGSTDATRAIAAEFIQREGRIRALCEPHRGITDALNTGIDACRGQFVARFDADDWMHPQRLELQVAKLLAQPELDAVGCHVRLFPRDRLSPKRLQYEAWLNSMTSAAEIFADRFVECPVAHPTLLLRTETLKQLRYREQGWAEDYDLVLRLLQKGPRVGVVARSLLLWRDGPARLSRTHEVYGLDRFVRCKASFLREDWLKARDSYVLWGYGDTGRSLCRALLEHGTRPSLIVDLHPGRIGQTIQGVRVIHPTQLSSENVSGDRIVASVSGTRARTDLRHIAATLNLREGHDYVVTA